MVTVFPGKTVSNQDIKVVLFVFRLLPNHFTFRNLKGDQSIENDHIHRKQKYKKIDNQRLGKNIQKRKALKHLIVNN